jgi:hypothetical protein
MDKQEAFDRLIRPLVDAIRIHCKELDIPALFDFLMHSDETKSIHQTCTTAGQDTGPDRAQLEALMVLNEGSLQDALTAVLASALENGLIQAGQPIEIGAVKVRMPATPEPILHQKPKVSH